MTETRHPPVASVRGLTAAEVQQRVRSGSVNATATRPSRTVAEILRANVLTPFNALLGALLVAILVVGPPQDGLFGLVIVANSAVGIVQELRAKHTLDRLSLLNAPTATVLRDGTRRQVPAGDVVLDDVVALGPGDQVVADGTVLDAVGLEVDESVLTGESEPVPRSPGDRVLSGSFVAAGNGWARVDAVGEEAYAAALAAEARRFTLVRSQIRDDLNRLLRVITWVLVPTATLLVTTQLLVEQQSLSEAVRRSVAGVVGMVPEGLVLLASVAFAVGVVRLGRRGVLVQDLPALEGLARVDVLGIDKTGTLTEGTITVAELVPLHGDLVAAGEALGALARADEHPNASMGALASRFPPPDGWSVVDRVPFSSQRKWSAATFSGRGTWVLGAPEVLLPSGDPALREAERRAAAGQRVLVLAGHDDGVRAEDPLPPLAPVALVVLAERLRHDARDTLRYFAEEGVTVKVISGDSPRTAGAVARALDLPGAERSVDARSLSEEGEGLGEAMDSGAVFGRVTPHQKRSMVRALRERGHVVAMTGDGVNDVLALKEADLGVAMGTGVPAARAVADLVLLQDQFAALPDVVGEGRRVIANIERVAHLFLTKTVYVTVLALAVGLARLPFPFYPRHLTLVSTLTIGVPAFFLALAPNETRARPGFLRRVLRFAVPAGFVAAAATFAAYAVTTLETDLGVAAARTTATVVLFGLGITVVALLALPPTRTEVLLLVAMTAAFGAVLALPPLRDFFALSTLPLLVWLSAGVLVLVAAGVLTAVWLRGEQARRPGPNRPD